MLTIAQWKRVCFKERRFDAFVDFTMQWDSRGAYSLHADATLELINIYQNYRDWDEAEWMSPRGTAKTTIGTHGWAWLTVLHPWLQTVFISATPLVSDDVFNYALYLAAEHPLLSRIRPLNWNLGKLHFDCPGRRGKGRSFRAKTGGSRITGARGHLVDIDDLEVKETVTTPTQRMKMRLTLSETENLHYKNHWFSKTMRRGTPWDEHTIYRDTMEGEHEQPVIIHDKARRHFHVEIPAHYVDGNGKSIYPFKLLPPEELARIKKKVRNDVLFRAQYLLDLSRDEEQVPIRSADLIFREFDWSSLLNRTMIVDPAGDRLDEPTKRAIVQGDKAGDLFAIGMYGTKNADLFVRDIWAESSSSSRFLDEVLARVKRFNPNRIVVESNFSGWSETIRLKLQSARLRYSIEPHHENKNKLSKVLQTICPMIADQRLIFHESLRDHEELRHQLLDLRYYALPEPYDDVIDNVAMSIDRLDEVLRVARAAQLTPAERAQAARAPQAIIDRMRRYDTRRIAPTSLAKMRGL